MNLVHTFRRDMMVGMSNDDAMVRSISLGRSSSRDIGIAGIVE